MFKYYILLIKLYIYIYLYIIEYITPIEIKLSRLFKNNY